MNCREYEMYFNNALKKKIIDRPEENICKIYGHIYDLGLTLILNKVLKQWKKKETYRHIGKQHEEKIHRRGERGQQICEQRINLTS